MSPIKGYNTKRFESKVVHGYKGYDHETGAISYPIYQSATFRHPSLGETTGYDYSRLKNPTRDELEQTMAYLEEGYAGFAFSSGMAAIATVVKLFKPGDHLIVSHDLYGGTYRLLVDIYSVYGIKVSLIDTTSTLAVVEAIQPSTKAIFIETPSNPTMLITDLREMSCIARENDLLLIVDNTFLTPYFQKPILLGADIVVHSGTKFLGGHNDTLAGIVVVNDAGLAERIALIQKSEGAVLAPFDSWLILRGIKTLAIRLDRQVQSAHRIAEWLEEQAEIEKVYYAGLSTHPGYEVGRSQSTGAGSMISFEVKAVEMVGVLLKHIQLITFAESLGGVESLMTYPMVQTHAAIPENLRNKIGVNDRLLRLSVGIEAVEDLIEDLEQALRHKEK
jgi:cystathionine gamma-synthase